MNLGDEGPVGVHFSFSVCLGRPGSVSSLSSAGRYGLSTPLQSPTPLRTWLSPDIALRAFPIPHPSKAGRRDSTITLLIHFGRFCLIVI